MLKKLTFPSRTIHLDFHTGPWIPDVARDFNPKQFAQTFKDARVDSVTVFATCHHGHAYWDTKRPERHPGLPKGFDLLGRQVEALHSVGIQAPIYLSVMCNEFCANTHPEWVALHADGKRVAPLPLEPGWQIMDMSSPYQDYLAEQLAEVCKIFAPVDGIFMDMCWDQPSCTKWAFDAMLKKSLNPLDESDRKKYSRLVVYEYMARYNKILAQYQKTRPCHGIWYNGRPKTNLHIEKKFLRHVEIECLPTGFWGYAYFPYVARYVRPFGLPTLSHTGRFHKSWGDNGALKPQAALKYECCLMLSQGITCGVGDLLHPRGVPNKATYELIGSVYKYIESCEPFVAGAKTVSEVAVLVDPELGDQPGPAGLGTVRALQQLRKQFDILPLSGNLKPYKLAIIPETTHIDAALKTRLQAFLKAGGALIVSGLAALDSAGQPVMKELGFTAHGSSPFSHTFLRPAKEISTGIAEFDTVMYERGFRMTPAKGARTLCHIVEPYFERAVYHFSGHEYTPPDKLSRYAAAVQAGRTITFAVPLLEAFGKHANVPYRQILGNCIDRLLPSPLIRDQGPIHLEATVVRAPGRTVVHLISYIPARHADNLDMVHDPVPLVEMPISVRTDKKPQRVMLQPKGQELEFSFSDGYVHTRATVLDGHAMLVIE
jgi:hypothetical protein